MRALTTQEGKVLAGGRLNTPVRLQVKDPGGTWRDLTALFGRDWVRSWEVDEDVDQPVAQLQCSLAREAYHDSLSSLRTDTRPNLLTGGFAPLLAPGAEVKFDVAVLPEGVAVVSGDWRNIFHGEIDRVELASNPMSFSARDLGGRLQDLFIQADRDYGSSPTGVAIETVIQQIITYSHGATFQVAHVYAAASGSTHGDRVTPTTHNGFYYRVTTSGTSAGSEPTWPTTIGNTVTSNTAVFTCAGRVPTLYTPTSPSFLVTTYTQQPQSVLEAIRSMALSLIGWDVRYRWRSATSQFELTLAVPDRATTTVLYTFDTDHYYAVPEFGIDRTTVRSQVDVVYSDAADLDAAGVPKRKTVSRQDKTSMDKWSGGLPRWMQLAEDATSQIDTSGEAGTVADGALSDLKDPKAVAAYDLPPFPFGELWDLYRFTADGVRYDSDQDLAVTGIRHSGSAGGPTRTTVRVTGRPVVAVEQWLRLEAGEIVPARFQGPQAPTGVTLAKVQGGLSVTWTRAVDGPTSEDFEIHASTSSGFTPSGATLKATTNGTGKTIGDLAPGTTYYVRVVPRDRNGNRGTASSETDTAAGYTPPRAMTPQVTYSELPFNPSFEAQTDPVAPPDTWSVTSGTWGTNVELETSSGVYSGRNAIKFTGAGRRLRSQMFPVNPFTKVTAMAWAVWTSGSATHDFFIGLEWFDSSGASLGSPAGTTKTAPNGGLVTEVGMFHHADAPGGANYAAVVVGSGASNNSGAVVVCDNVRAIAGHEQWTSVAGSVGFGTGWSAITDPGFRRDAAGQLWLRGLVSQGSSTANGTIFTLPAGYRPGSQQSFVLAYEGTGSVAIVHVNTSGTLVVFTTFALNKWISLSGISFLAEQ